MSNFDLMVGRIGKFELLRQLIRQDLAQRYRGTYLGILWSLAVPLTLLGIYTFVFGLVLGVRGWDTVLPGTGTAHYAVALFAGLIPFTVVAETMVRAPSLIVAVPNYVKKTVFPLHFLPVVAVGTAAIQSLAAVAVLIGAVLVGGGSIAPALALLPMAYLPLLLLCLVIGWLFAALGVYVRDLSQGVGLLSQVVLFGSPVLYPSSAVPDWARYWIAANPLTPIIAGFRWVLLGQPPPDFVIWSAWVFGLAALAALAYAWFQRVRDGFADLL